MTNGPTRHVHFLEDDDSIRSILFMLFSREPCVGRVARSEEGALTIITRDQFDAVLLDLQYVNPVAGEGPIQIRSLSPVLVGRVLVITGEVTDPEAMEVIARICVPHVPPKGLIYTLWNRLRTILNHFGFTSVASALD